VIVFTPPSGRLNAPAKRVKPNCVPLVSCGLVTLAISTLPRRVLVIVQVASSPDCGWTQPGP